MSQGPGDGAVWQVRGLRAVFEGRWVQLHLAELELPGGERFTQPVVRMPAFAVLALLDDPGERVLLMWRHRFLPDRWSWELPGGRVEPGEDPATSAARETEEETGYRPRRVQHVVTYQPMIGALHSPHHIFVGHGAERIGPATDSSEAARLEWTPLTELAGLIAAGQVHSSGSLIALLHLLAVPGPQPRAGAEPLR